MPQIFHKFKVLLNKLQKAKTENIRKWIRMLIMMIVRPNQPGAFHQKDLINKFI